MISGQEKCAVSSRQASWEREVSLWMLKGEFAHCRRGKGHFFQKGKDTQTYRGRFRKALCGWSMECIIADGAGMKCGTWCEQVEEREPGKGQGDESENGCEHVLCPSKGIQVGHREHLLNCAGMKDENSSKHTLKQIPLLQTKARSVTQNQEKHFPEQLFLAKGERSRRTEIFTVLLKRQNSPWVQSISTFKMTTQQWILRDISRRSYEAHSRGVKLCRKKGLGIIWTWTMEKVEMYLRKQWRLVNQKLPAHLW